MLSRIYYSLQRRFWHLLNRRKFKYLGEKSFIKSSLNISGSYNISIGRDVLVGYKSWLAAVPHTGYKDCSLSIGDGCKIGNFNHIYATKSIVIGNNVLTADKVYISDNLHSYEDVKTPIWQQPIKQLETVSIGDNSWIGECVTIMGSKIGKHCVIGANSVVTKDVPDYCVVVGAPAKIIKRYDFDVEAWRKTDKDGNFLNENK